MEPKYGDEVVVVEETSSEMLLADVIGDKRLLVGLKGGHKVVEVAESFEEL